MSKTSLPLIGRLDKEDLAQVIREIRAHTHDHPGILFFPLKSPAVSDWYPLIQAASTLTFTAISGSVSDASTAVDLVLEKRSTLGGAATQMVTLTATPNGTEKTTWDTNVLEADSFLVVRITAVTGSPDTLALRVETK